MRLKPILALLQASILLLLQQLTLATTELSKFSTQFMEETYKDQSQIHEQIVKVTRAQLAYIKVVGYAEIKVSIKSSRLQVNDLSCSVYAEKICMLWNFELSAFDESESFEVKVKTRLFKMGGDYSGAYVRLIGGRFIEVECRSRTFIELLNTNNVDVLVRFRELSPDLVASKSKIQFFVMQGFMSRITNMEYVKMFMRPGNERATSAKYNSVSTSSLGYGAVMTLIPQDKEYCFDANCLYALRIETLNVKALEVMAEVFDKDTEVQMKEGVFLLDQLRDNDDATYIMTTKDGLGQDGLHSNWRFNLIAIEGNADVAIAGDTKPKTYSDYHWKSNFDSSEGIFVSGKEIQELGLSGEKFYVHVNSTTQSTFMMLVTKKISNSSEPITPNEPITGEAKPGEIINYVYQGWLDVPEKISFFATLTAVSGDPDLYVKECENMSEPCLISEEDKDKISRGVYPSDKLVKSSSQATGDDGVFLEFVCIPQTEKYKDYVVTEESLKGPHVSKSCRFAVSVVGKPSSTQSMSRYVLELKGAKYHVQLTKGQTYNFKIDQKKTHHFLVDIDQSDFDQLANSTNPSQQIVYLNYKLIVVSGDADIYTSRSFPFPNGKSFDNEFTIDNNNMNLHSQVKYISIRGTPASLKGRHYLGIYVGSD